MQNKIEATKFLEEKLNEIYFIDCYVHSNHGINISFALCINKMDLSKFHPDRIFFYDKKGKWLMDYYKRRNIFWLSHSKIWAKLEKDFGFNDQEITNLTKDILEKHFKRKIKITEYI